MDTPTKPVKKRRSPLLSPDAIQTLLSFFIESGFQIRVGQETLTDQIDGKRRIMRSIILISKKTTWSAEEVDPHKYEQPLHPFPPIMQEMLREYKFTIPSIRQNAVQRIIYTFNINGGVYEMKGKILLRFDTSVVIQLDNSGEDFINHFKLPYRISVCQDMAEELPPEDCALILSRLAALKAAEGDAHCDFEMIREWVMGNNRSARLSYMQYERQCQKLWNFFEYRFAEGYIPIEPPTEIWHDGIRLFLDLSDEIRQLFRERRGQYTLDICPYCRFITLQEKRGHLNSDTHNGYVFYKKLVEEKRLPSLLRPILDLAEKHMRYNCTLSAGEQWVWNNCVRQAHIVVFSKEPLIKSQILL